ncbi:MAG: hypothetical protein LBP62_00545 [Clostridiales bacterium]|jgi:hypothetical protein|nr:hypothetical protein [Clostridiales bacterium]
MDKRWSKIKKHLESSLCDRLKGRVTYFATSYRGAHDGQGRVAILVDKKEIINAPFSTWNGDCFSEYAEWENSTSEDKGTREDIIKRIDDRLARNGIFEPVVFADAYDEFCTCPITECLSSDNYITRIIAVIDKRTGRQTLEKMKDSMENEPAWFRYFYDLRVNA